MINNSTTIRDLNSEHLSHLDIGEDDPRVSMEIETGGTVTVQFAEHLRFHRERGLPAGIVDNKGDLTEPGRKRIEEHVRGLLFKESRIDPSAIDVDSYFGDEQGFNVTMRVTVPDSTTVLEFYRDNAWPFIATLINVTDPGTFNKPYLFTDI